jgi:hypothetical protein
LSFHLCFCVGCGDDDSGDVGVTVPRATQVYPEDGATDVNLNTYISVWFLNDMDEASLDSIYVIGVPSHHVTYDRGEKKANAYLDTILAPETGYQVMISTWKWRAHSRAKSTPGKRHKQVSRPASPLCHLTIGPGRVLYRALSVHCLDASPGTGLHSRRPATRHVRSP